MSEWDVIRGLRYYLHCKGQQLVFPNSCVFGWESDLIQLTRAGLIHEYEVKLTRGDFLADAKKNKHTHIQACMNNLERVPKLIQGVDFGHTKRVVKPSNYLWYVLPAGIVQQEEVPEYAGIIEFLPGEYYQMFSGTCVVRQAPKIHREKVTLKHKDQLLKSMTYRYWRLKVGDGF